MNDKSAVEYRVVWRWREERWKGDTEGMPWDERTSRHPYKTRKGAARLLAKLQSNGGRYEKHDDDPYSGDLIVERLVLDYAYIQTRFVSPWIGGRFAGSLVGQGQQ